MNTSGRITKHDEVGELTEKIRIEQLYADIAPAEGRDSLAAWKQGLASLTWAQGGFSLAGRLAALLGPVHMTVAVQGRLVGAATADPRGWVELETAPSDQILVGDIFVVGSRPLPSAGITCLCRHPARPQVLVAATADGRLLFVDAELSANLSIIGQLALPVPAVSLVVSGNRLIALTALPDQELLVLELAETGLGVAAVTRIALPTSLVDLAEGDQDFLWGLRENGIIYRLRLIGTEGTPAASEAPTAVCLEEHCRLRRQVVVSAGIQQIALSIYRALKSRIYSLWRLFASRGEFRSFAYDGRFFWAVRDRGRHRSASLLMLYDGAGRLQRAFSVWPEASVTSLNSFHSGLWVVDREHDRVHRCHMADTMQPVAGGPLVSGSHPGYLPAGTSRTANIHDLCLLYVGGVGSQRAHRYDVDQLKPLVGYLSPQGDVQDIFMDGFLMLAQYSPLLNGRTFSPDLRGQPSRQRDWSALFDEYFHPQCNLMALDGCAGDIARQLNLTVAGCKLKVVLAIPTPDRRCLDWDERGRSLAESQNRVAAVAWAMLELLGRWRKVGFRWLELAGFYYMDEQGSYDDPVLQAFPGLCRQNGLSSFAIPGLTSTGMTEFTRAGFDGVALQSSQAFRKSLGRPPRYWLKCAGRIAREFGMGMEVELPYNVHETAGQKVVRDYLGMARIQGWAGAFKAYFQSYDLICQLASSSDPGCRALYDELYRFSRCSGAADGPPQTQSVDNQPVDWHQDFELAGVERAFRLNIEGNPGGLELTHLDLRPTTATDG